VGEAALQDTGIQPSVSLLSTQYNDDTYFASSMSALASQLTPAGDGTTAAHPKKALILITDGFEDDGPRQAMLSSVCDQFKNNNMNYTVFVVWTTYYPVKHIAYFTSSPSWIPIVEGSGTDSIRYNLQQCASTPADFITADDGPSLNAAMLSFLARALPTPARFTQ
jgi:hypothetical protein